MSKLKGIELQDINTMDNRKNTVSTVEDVLPFVNSSYADTRRDDDRQYTPQPELPVLQKGKRDNIVNDKLMYPQFEAKTTNIQLLHRLISSVQLFGDFCMLDISSDGLSFAITDGNVCKIRLNLNKNVFQSFTFNGVWKGNNKKYTDDQIYGDETDLSDEDTNDYSGTNGFDTSGVVSLHINITSFIESINILMKDSKMGDNVIECTFRYEREGDPFVIIFEDELIVERCELTTYYSDEHVKLRKQKNKKSQGKKGKKDRSKEATPTISELVKDFDIDSGVVDESLFQLDAEKIIFDIIIKSDILHDIVKDMGDLLTERFILYCKKSRSTNNLSSREKSSKLIFLSKSSADSFGFSKLIIPDRKANIPDFKIFKPVFENPHDIDDAGLVDCDDLSLSSTYHFHYFAKLLRAIKLSKMIKLRKDMNGITSLLLLLGKSGMSSNQQTGIDKLHGSSIEFMTLESISINDFSTFHENHLTETILSKLGYENKFVEQLIKDDQEIQTIRVGNDGQLVTLDEFFGNPINEFEEIENLNMNNRHAAMTEMQSTMQNEYIPVENLLPPSNEKEPISNTRFDETRSNKILNLTEQLAMSLLGHANPNEKQLDENNNIQVEKTFYNENNDDEDSEDDGCGKSTKRKRVSNNIKLRNKNKGSSKKRGKGGKGNQPENNGIETVGGAIEIPLFI